MRDGGASLAIPLKPKQDDVAPVAGAKPKQKSAPKPNNQVAAR
jgi:hypothetical protein